MSDEQPALRVALVGIVVVSMFAALFARLYYLQVLRTTTVEQVFGGPLLRDVSYEGTRGRILDRNGKVLVDNRESIVVTIDRRQFDALTDKSGLELRLARALNAAGIPTKVSDVTDRIEDPRYDPLKPVPIAEDVSPELESYLLERLYEFPAVDVVRTQIRTYPHGSLAAHLLGYTGSINSDELDAHKNDPKSYEPGDEIGKAGLERVFEKELRATPGKRTIEVDATEREIGTRSDIASVPGADLRLTIDLDVQQATEILLQDALSQARQQKKRKETDPDLRAPAGAAVVLDAATSQVVAMASYPTYDPSEFIGGISEYRFNELNDPAAFYPLVDRAVQSLYSPGSTFKPFTAVAALEKGAISADEVINDNGSYTLDDCTDTCVFSNANSTRYGKVDLRRAITVSSDVYFYRLGEELWKNQDSYGGNAVIQQTARAFGMGTASGVQLPDEAAGLISDPAFKAARHDQNPEAFPFGEWFTGDNVNLAIGQGDLLVTPLQLANAYAALANGGVLHVPSLANSLLDHDTGATTRDYAPREASHIDLPAAVRQPIIDGLAGVVSSDEGTAYPAFRGFPLDQFTVAGKTGTAESPPRADTALFAGFTPVDNPKYVVVAVIEEAGFASETAAPLVRRIMEQLPEIKPSVPIAASTTTTTAGGTTTTADASNEALNVATSDETTTTRSTPTATTAPPATTAPATTAPAPTTTEAAPTAPPSTTTASTADSSTTSAASNQAAPADTQSGFAVLPVTALVGAVGARRRRTRRRPRCRC